MKKRNRRRLIGRILLFLMVAVLMLGGLYIALFQNVEDLLMEAERRKAVNEYRERQAAVEPETQGAAEQDPPAPGDPLDLPAYSDPAQPATEPTEPENKDITEIIQEDKKERYAELWEALRSYNKNLYRTGQAKIADPWAYAGEAVDLKEYGYEDPVFGALTIPAMNVELPIYLGASWEHMRHGAAQMTETSMPIGGKNTNSVFAIHRDYVMDVEVLKTGDEILIQNPWEQLRYEIIEIQVIYPYEGDKIRIRSGQDLITLVTCHPWGSGGRYRYLVIAERLEENRQQEAPVPVLDTSILAAVASSIERWTGGFKNEIPEELEISEGIEFVSSRRDISAYRFFPAASIVVCLLIIVLVLWQLRGSRENRKNQDNREKC